MRHSGSAWRCPYNGAWRNVVLVQALWRSLRGEFLNQPTPLPAPTLKPIPPKRRDLLAGREKQAVLWSLAVLFACTVLFFVTLPDVRQVAKAAPGNAIQIFDRDDKLVVTIDGDEEREFVSLKDIPKVMQQSLIAAEDHNFYKHDGISFRGITRAFINNAEAGRVVEGGSTITQQLAKNLFFEGGDRSMIRKVREAVLAVEIEHSYSKDQILEMYLNQVYFGRGAYGLERAARRYFGKSSRLLTLPEAAYLAGLLKAPSRYGENLKEAVQRQHLVLGEMQELSLVTAAQVANAKKAKLAFSRSTARMTKFPYYMSAVQDFLSAKLPKKDLADGGLRVFTNLDQSAQRLAEHTLAQRVRSAGRGMNQAALVSVLVEDSSVVALVGGAGDYWKHQYNSATGPHTMGSAFKPFVYLTCFTQGRFSPETAIDDSPIVVPQTNAPAWQPKNFDGEYYGTLSVREAIALSRNIPAVRAGLLAGIGNVIETAQAAGIQSELIATPALLLGASAASPLEMASAYATIARGGSYIPPCIVRRVEGSNGYYKDFKGIAQKLFPDSPVRALISCMESVVKEGTGTGARLVGRPVAGKTGTSDEARDLWFVGFTPHMVTAVWGGNDQHHSLGGLTGGAVLTGIWRVYNQAYYKAHKIPAGTFYTETNPTDNLWDRMPWKPAEPAAPVPVEPAPEAQTTEGAESAPTQTPESERGFFIDEGRRDQATEQQPDMERNQQPPGFVPLPGAPQPGHVRQPSSPSLADPFAPRRYSDEPIQDDGPPLAPDRRQRTPVPQVPQMPGPSPYASPERAPGPAPEFRQPGPAEGDAGLNQRIYGEPLREPINESEANE